MSILKEKPYHQDNDTNLSPAFDLVNVNLVNPADDEELALTLNGKKKRLGLKDFVILGNSLQIPEKAFRNSFRKFNSRNKLESCQLDIVV